MVAGELDAFASLIAQSDAFGERQTRSCLGSWAIVIVANEIGRIQAVDWSERSAGVGRQAGGVASY